MFLFEFHVKVFGSATLFFLLLFVSLAPLFLATEKFYFAAICRKCLLIFVVVVDFFLFSVCMYVYDVCAFNIIISFTCLFSVSEFLSSINLIFGWTPNTSLTLRRINICVFVLFMFTFSATFLFGSANSYSNLIRLQKTIRLIFYFVFFLYWKWWNSNDTIHMASIWYAFLYCLNYVSDWHLNMLKMEIIELLLLAGYCWLN